MILELVSCYVSLQKHKLAGANVINIVTFCNVDELGPWSILYDTLDRRRWRRHTYCQLPVECGQILCLLLSLHFLTVPHLKRTTDDSRASYSGSKMGLSKYFFLCLIHTCLPSHWHSKWYRQEEYFSSHPGDHSPSILLFCITIFK